MPDLDEPFDIKWRVVGHANAAQIAYYHLNLEVFMHQHDDEDVVRIYATGDWLDEVPDETAEYARAWAEGTVVDPDDPFDHTRVDEP